MSDASKPISEDQPLDFDQLQRECEEITSEVIDLIMSRLNLPEGRASWMHAVGVAFIVLARSYLVPGVPPACNSWAHSRLMLIDGAMHAYEQGGPDAVTKYFAECSSAAPDSHGHSLH